MLPTLISLAALSMQPETVLITQDDTVIDRSCRVLIPADAVLHDDEGDGVIHVTASDIEIVFDERARLIGSDGTPDQMSGVGIRIIGQENVVIRNAVIGGFKVGIWATDSDGMELHDIDVRSNFAQHLGSTPMAEDASDWLWPHRNDDNEWMRNYGGSIWIEDASDITVRGVKVRHAQNGIVLDNVSNARVYDNDASFLSGWGLAMWRTTDSVIARNAFDFCVRGYSHGIYNRGQDSAGLLVFEQCSNNLFAENSATHGGDGLFAFAGHGALGEQWYNEKRREAERAGKNPDDVEIPADVIARHRGKGNNDNLFIGNDFSYAVAHGLELTFSFDNVVARNVFKGNGICGIWGGYSQRTLITENAFIANGDMGYGLERGGVNIEHGYRNVISHNTFEGDRCGVHFWDDADTHLLRFPWSLANHKGCTENVIVQNEFTENTVAIHLRDSKKTTVLWNEFDRNSQDLDVEGEEPSQGSASRERWTAPQLDIPGESRPVGARAHLAGREHIIMDEWGPWDHESPLVRLSSVTDGEHAYEVFAPDGFEVAVSGDVKSRQSRPLHPGDSTTVIIGAPSGGVHAYELLVRGDDWEATFRDSILKTAWDVAVFEWTEDPRENLASFRRDAEASTLRATIPALELVFGGGGPRNVWISDEITAKGPGGDGFGLVASTTVPLPAGTWKLKTRSDDGIRVMVNGETLIEDWTWHGPTPHDATFEVEDGDPVTIEVEYFELNGHAELQVDLERVE